MLLVDDLLMSPLRGLMFVVREIARAVERVRESERQALMADLSALHRALDAGEIDERTFVMREVSLLERLDKLQDAGSLQNRDIGSRDAGDAVIR